MSNIMQLISEGKITVEDLASVPKIIERAKLVKEALEACSKTIVFPFGEYEICCYEYTDRAGEYHSWGKVANNGYFTCYSNWGGNHTIGHVNLFDSHAVLLALDDIEFSNDLLRFLTEQIEKVKEENENNY